MTTPAVPSPFTLADRWSEIIGRSRHRARRTGRKIRKAYRSFVKAFQFYSTFGFWTIVLGWILFH